MPEFRLRRKKDKEPRRRHTLHDDTDMTQLQEAARLFDQQTEIIFGPNERSVDAAIEGANEPSGGRTEGMFVNGPSSSEPPLKAIANRKISSKYSDCLYLRYGTNMRRCPLPSPITVSTIKQLFINLFDLSPSIDKNPAWHLFVLDRSNTWKRLHDVSYIHDQCTLLLVDSSNLGTSPMPPAPPQNVHRSSTGTPEDDNTSLSENEEENLSVALHDPIISLSERGQPEGTQNEDNNIPLMSDGSTAESSLPQPVATNVKQTDGNCAESVTIEQLKKEIATLKASHELQIQSLQTELMLARQSSLQVDPELRVSSFRQERLTVEPLKNEYMRECEAALNEISLLQSIGEALKLDAIHHRSKVNTEEVETLLSMAENSSTTFTNLQERYDLIATKLKGIMQKELEVIVSEEQLIKEEAKKLKTATEACKTLTETFTTLQQLASLQVQRPLQIPIFHSRETDSQDHSHLVESINSINPDHKARLEAIKETESIMDKKKRELTPTKRALRKFELALRQRQNELKPTDKIALIDKERSEKLKSLYIREKQERQKEIERELELTQKALREKRKQEIAEVEKRLDFASLREEMMKEEELKRLEDERRKLSDERRRQEEERARLDRLRDEQEEHQKTLKDLQRQQEDERRRIELERMQQQEERRKIEEDKKHWQEYLRLGSESPDTRVKRKELLWQHAQQRIQLDNEREQKQITDIKQQRRAHTMKEGSLNDFTRHFKEVDNIPAIPILAPPVSHTSRSHKDLRHNTTDFSARSNELTRRPLAPAISNDLQRTLVSNGLPKFSSEDSLIKQNLYDSPWTSKKMLLQQQPAAAQGAGRRGTVGSISTAQHKRHKSDVNETPPTIPKHNWSSSEDRNRQTPSPTIAVLASTRVPVSGASGGKSMSQDLLLSNSVTMAPRSSSLEEHHLFLQKPHHNSPDSPPAGPHGYSPPTLANGTAPPPYSQIASASYPSGPSFNGGGPSHPPSQWGKAPESGSRVTQYPVHATVEIPKYKPSISYV